MNPLKYFRFEQNRNPQLLKCLKFKLWNPALTWNLLSVNIVFVKSADLTAWNHQSKRKHQQLTGCMWLLFL